MKLISENQLLENRIIKRFQKALTDYCLIEDDDYILVALSGGKDSLCLLELLARRMQIFKPRFKVEAVHVKMENISYESDSQYLENFAQQWGVKLHILTTSFNTETDKRKAPCFLCSWNRRKKIFSLAQELGCNKLAFGHHMDDIIHTTMMNEYFQGRYCTMPVKLKLQKMPLTIIRPLCLEHEADMVEYARIQGYRKQNKNCPYEKETHRSEVKSLFEQIERMNPEARFSVWNALEKANKLIEE